MHICFALQLSCVVEDSNLDAILLSSAIEATLNDIGKHVLVHMQIAWKDEQFNLLLF